MVHIKKNFKIILNTLINKTIRAEVCFVRFL